MKVSYTPASEIDLYEPDPVFHRVVPVESVEDRQGESRNATTPRSSITQRYQQLPGHDPSSRMATKIDRQCASCRHAASNSQDDSSASRLSSQRSSLRRTGRDRISRELFRLSVPLPTRESTEWRKWRRLWNSFSNSRSQTFFIFDWLRSKRPLTTFDDVSTDRSANTSQCFE